MGGFLILFLVLGLLAGGGYILSGTTPTVESIQEAYYQKAFKEFKGRQDVNFTQVYEFLMLARITIQDHPNMTFSELDRTISAQIEDKQLRRNVRIILGTIQVQAIKAARAKDLDVNDPSIKNAFLLAALDGFQEGTMAAELHEGKPTPGMERAR